MGDIITVIGMKWCWNMVMLCWWMFDIERAGSLTPPEAIQSPFNY
jgi:hypothetical protein